MNNIIEICDHVVGVIHFEDNEFRSELAYLRQVKAKREYYDETLWNDISVKFNFCPICGREIKNLEGSEFPA